MDAGDPTRPSGCLGRGRDDPARRRAAGGGGEAEAFGAEAARVPEGLSPERAWRWCVMRTMRDMRMAARRGRPMSLPNALRLLRRRWGRIAKRQAV